MDKYKFLVNLSEGEHSSVGKVDFGEQSEEQKVFSAVWTLQSEVDNGGLAYYFERDAGQTVGFASAALRRIGADHCAEIVDRALQAVCAGVTPSDASGWRTLLGGMSGQTGEILDALDAEFFESPDDLTELLFDFVGNHPEVFGPVKVK